MVAILVLQMKILYYIFVFTLLCSCSNNSSNADYITTRQLQTSVQKTYNNTIVEIRQLHLCNYPAGDPLFSKKENKKIAVLQVTVTRLTGSKKEDIIPFEITLVDERGNSYKNSPGIIALAQSNTCINGDDLSDYNAIWNGDINVNETRTAYAIGFEIPNDARIAKLFWNKKWKDKNQYLTLNN